MPDLEINNRYSGLLDPIDAASRLFERLHLSKEFPIGGGELSVVFVSDAEIAKIHADFMNDPTPTDVITFPADTHMDSAGEIIVSVDHAKTRAAELNLPFSKELSLYLVHGWLHLAGFDDREDADRARMREAEQRALTLLDAAEEPIHFQLL